MRVELVVQAELAARGQVVAVVVLELQAEQQQPVVSFLPQEGIPHLHSEEVTPHSIPDR